MHIEPNLMMKEFINILSRDEPLLLEIVDENTLFISTDY